MPKFKTKDVTPIIVYKKGGCVLMLLKVNVHEAKTNLSKLLAQVEEGKEVIIARAGKPVARLVPIERQTAQRIPGSAKGKLVVANDFDAPLPEDIPS